MAISHRPSGTSNAGAWCTPTSTSHTCPRRLTALMEGLQIQWLIDPASVDIPARVRTRLDELLTVSLWD
ncbi:hypothetical protein GCM10025876_10010 [Demequina litorisediminis]|uniref:WYL domain-containing protein n=1 Tax=Demequina litorisediminis TaxID=1849022 RepID=A0ABQ6IAB5_9MICO|nr:hypothetical protein GCM10025876_10010 [Demequina litorisediminis]